MKQKKTFRLKKRVVEKLKDFVIRSREFNKKFTATEAVELAILHLCDTHNQKTYWRRKMQMQQQKVMFIGDVIKNLEELEVKENERKAIDKRSRDTGRSKQA